MEKQKNTPVLRFAEYSEEWEKKNLGDVADIKRGAASNHLKYVENPSDGVRLLRINDFLNDDAVYIQDTNDIKRFRVKTNDLLIAGTGATAGIIYIVPEKFNDLSFSYNAPRIRVKDAYHYFIYYYLKSDIILKQQKRLFVGNAQPFLDTDSMRGLRIGVPSLSEQEKIATFITAIDKIINQLKQKKTLLEQYKKGVMQKIFDQEIRFKDDDGNEFPDWEEKELGVISDVRDGTHDSPKYIDNGFPLITSKNLLASGRMDFDNVSLISEVDFHKINKRSGVNIGDILFGMIGTIGNPVLVEKDGFAIKNVALIKEKNTLKNCFLIHFLNSDSIIKQFHNENTGGTQKFLALNVIRSLLIQLPCLPEQTKIANFLSAIDEKINGCSNQINKTEQYKTGLLQKLFV